MVLIVQIHVNISQGVSWPDVSNIGRYCPHLKVLKLPTVVDCVLENRSLPDAVREKEMSILPHLRIFSLERLVPYGDEYWLSHSFYYSTENISRLFSWLLGGMPVLEDLTIGHGLCSDAETSLRLPDIGQGLSECPPTLRKLHLKDFNLKPTSLLSPGIDSDLIESITLENCGDSQTDALRSFCLRYQGDEGAQKDISIGVGEDGTSYFVRGAGDITPPADVFIESV